MSSGRYDGDDASEHDPEAAHLEKTVKNLLTARASATASYYWQEFGDQLKPEWLAEFQSQSRHSIKEVGWQGFLAAMMRTEPEEIVVRKRAQRPRGGSGNNPFLSDDRYAMEYTVLIEPAEIAKRIMLVREQLAQEWSQDLELVENENAELLRHHADTITMDAAQANQSRHLVFEHEPNGTKTPYRGKNYRELLALVTKVAVRRYEVDLRQSGRRFHQNWLERFMAKDGRDLEGNALVEAMLNGPMTMINPKIGGGMNKPRVIEPAQIAKGVMKSRAAAAAEIQRFLETVPSDHFMLKRAMLELQWAAAATTAHTHNGEQQ